MSLTNQIDIDVLDLEWVDLILNARNLGVSMDDIRAFLRSTAYAVQNVHSPTKNEQVYVPEGFIVNAEM